MNAIPVSNTRAADAVMILDIVEQVLLNADNPVQAGKEMAGILGELTGAKVVTIMLLDKKLGHGVHKTMVVNPARRNTPELQDVAAMLAGQAMGLAAPCLWHDLDSRQTPDLKRQLHRMEMDNTIVAPLVSAREHVGCLLLLGLPEEDFGRTKVLRALKMASRVLALTINNVLLYEDQEATIALRTAELTAANQALNLENKERKHAEQQLQLFRNYLANIIDSMPSVLVGVDVDCNVTVWNQTAERATGIIADDVRGKPIADVFPPIRAHLQKITESIKTGKIKQAQKVFRRFENAVCYEDITIYPLVSSAVEGAVIRIDNVTDQVRMQEIMIQSEKMLSVGGLAAGMAHEINNPLAGILQNAAVLENRLLGDLSANHKAAQCAGTTMDTIRQYLEARKLPGMIKSIRDSGKRAAIIVKNMLSFARKSDRVVSDQDLALLLDQTLELVRTDYNMKKHYDFKQIHIEREYDQAAPSVPCEGSKLQQVFMNILKNGAEAMAEMPTASAPPAFVLRVRDDFNWVQAEIEDNGPGMDEKTRRRIFEPFFTTKAVGQGTGLGLSVSYFIVTEDHGGEMNVRSGASGGTCFVIRLPKDRQCKL